MNEPDKFILTKAKTEDSDVQQTSASKLTNVKKAKSRGRPNDSSDVQLSKTLSYILRHGAAKEGLKMRPDGFIPLSDLLARPKLKGITTDDIYRIVAENEKQRFTIREEAQPDGSKLVLIRANQGHSLKVQELELEPVTDPAELPVVVHGTYAKCWEDIAREGLRPMKRTHIHFAKGLIGQDGVISGMRASCDTFIYLDVEKCLSDNIVLFWSSNGVILTEGLPISRSIPVQYFKRVVNKAGTVLYPTSSTVDSNHVNPEVT